MNLLNLLKYQMGANLTDQMAGLFGEKPAVTQTALDAMLPSIMSVFVKKSSDRAGAQAIMDTIASGGHDGTLLNTLHSTFNRGGGGQKLMEMGKELSTQFLGGKKEKLAQAVAGFSKIQPSIASQLVDMCMPLVLGVVGKQVKSQKLDTSGLMYLLSTQKGHIGAAIPSGFANAGILQSLNTATPTPKPISTPTPPPVSSPKTLNERLAESQAKEPPKNRNTNVAQPVVATPATQPEYTYAKEKKGFLAYLPFIIGGVLLLALLLFGIRSCSKNTQTAENPKTKKNVAPAKTKADSETKNLTDSQTPSTTDGSTENTPPKTNESPSYNDDYTGTTTPAGGFKSQVEGIVGQGSYSGQSVAMEGLQFRGNSATIKGDSRHIVKELAEVMQSKPSMKVKVEASPLVRAISVKKSLMDAGVDRSRIEASEGNSSTVQVYLY